jgi:hypothetical protein
MNLLLALTVGLPSILQGYVIGLLALTLGVAKWPHFDGPILCTYWRPWVEARWRYSTTIGAWMGKAIWANETTIYHEKIHCQQYIDLNVLGAVLGACLIPWIGWQGFLIVWGTSGAPWLLPNFVTAVIRHKRRGVSWLDAAYMLSMHERAAYAITAEQFR